MPEDAPAGDYTGEIVVSSSNAGALTVPVIVDVSNPPNQPVVPAGPTTVGTHVVFPYSTYATDPEGDPIYYKFDWGDGEYSRWFGPFDSGATCTARHSWLEPGTYEVRAIAKDDQERFSDWSEPLVVNVNPTELQPLDQPVAPAEPEIKP